MAVKKAKPLRVDWWTKDREGKTKLIESKLSGPGQGEERIVSRGELSQRVKDSTTRDAGGIPRTQTPSESKG